MSDEMFIDSHLMLSLFHHLYRTNIADAHFSSSLFILFNKMSTPALYEKRTDSRDSFWICVLRFIRDNSRTRNQRWKLKRLLKKRGSYLFAFDFAWTDRMKRRSRRHWSVHKLRKTIKLYSNNTACNDFQ